MAEKTLVSIFCVTYNHRPYIQQCLDSLLEQKTDFPFEVIIHDDASTDGTAEIIREYELRFPHIVVPILQKENQYSKGNHAIIASFMMCRARGEYICICEGDDYWCDLERLQRQTYFLKNNIKYGMCYSKVAQYIQRDNKFSRYSFGGPAETTIELMQGNCVPTLSTCIRRDLYVRYLEEIQPERKNWKMGDYPLWLWVSYNSKIHYENRITGVYRVLQESASHTDDISKWLTYFKSIQDITRFFSLKYNIPVKKMYIEYDENLAKRIFAFNTLNRLMLVEVLSKAGGLSLKGNICLMLCKSRLLFWIVVLYKEYLYDR